jgi:hypothetical protein
MADDVFKILVLGDFSGTFAKNRPAPKLKPLFIDRDNFEDVLGAMNVSLDVGGRKVTFTELDDFDPDRICDTFGLLHDRDAPPPPAGDLLGAIMAEQGDEDVDAEDIPVSAEDADDLSAFVTRVTAA